MKEEAVKILSISELIQLSRPLAGSSSLNSGRPIEIIQPSDEPLKPLGVTDPNPNPRILKPLNHPTILIGTLTLPSHDNPSSSNPAVCCPKTSCFSFSDDSASICCDILDLDLRIIGKKIHILAWNFIPFKNGGGFLEIIRWCFPESSRGLGQFSSNSSNSDTFSLVSDYSFESKDTLNARYSIYGVLESVSPVSVVPCTMGVRGNSGSNSGGPRNLCGFLAQIFVCGCKLCSSKGSVKSLEDITEGQNSHCFTKSVIVYFCGSASSWHPVISRLIGNSVLLSGLKKKLVFIGGEESQVMYVTTEKALLHLHELSDPLLPNQRTDIEGKGECAVYTGTVTGIYMQGMVVELDREVYLLLTDQQLILPHSLRVGAIVTLRNVHFVNPRFSWTRLLILGACFKTSICVKSFSPMETGCRMYSQSHSLLGKFIDTLVFSARLWVLLVVSCFRKKFVGILSEKEILGSKHLIWTVTRCYQKEGLAQKYSSSCLPLTVFRFRHGVFMEYCKHESCGCGNEANYGHLRLVVPISNFISHFEATWIKMLLECKTNSDIIGNNNQYSLLSCEGRSYCQTIRRFLQSEDIGVVLLGVLKISPSSRRLQLIDATGSIDIVVPDLPSTWSINDIYELNDFTVVMEGVPEQVDRLGSIFNKLLSCRNIFSCVPLVGARKLESYLFCQLRNEKSRNRTFCPGMDWQKNFEELESGRLHLLWVTHKFHVLPKFRGDQVISNRSSIFAEAIVLPWDLLLNKKDGDTHATGFSADHLRDLMEHYTRRGYQERVAQKRCKTNQASSGSPSPGLSDDGSGHLDSYSIAYYKSYGEQNCYDLSYPLEIPCFIAGRSVNGHCLPGSGTSLHYARANLKISSGCKPGARKMLLEFESDSVCQYELLRIGGYYMIKHHKEDILCTIKDSNDVSDGKVVITSRTHLWSLSFSSDEVLLKKGQPLVPPFHDPFVCNKEDLSKDSRQIELPILRFSCACPKIHPDMYLFLSADVLSLLEVELKVLEEGLIKPSISLKEVANVSQCIGIMTPSVQSSGTSDYVLPKGNLISLHGYVVAVHNSNNSSLAAHLILESACDVHRPKFFQGVTGSICIHVLVEHHIVKLFGSFGKHTFPIGFGPGVNATFHRILLLGGQSEFMLTPASFIVINSIMAVNHHQSVECDSPLVASGLQNVAAPETVPATLISEVIKCLECKPMQLHCKVVAVYVLVLEKNRKVVHSQPRMRSGSPVVNIPLAGFILDDGSSPCCCWANSERAAILLRLHEGIPREASVGSFGRSEKSEIDKAHRSSICHVDKILKQHGRVVVKNYGSMFDSSCQDLTFSVGSDAVLSNSDEELLKFIILDACFSTFWSVVGSLMDSNATGQLEKRLMQHDMTMLPLQNIWATEVFHSNPVTEARNIIQELLNR